MIDAKRASAYTLKYVTLKTAQSPEDQESNRKRYVGVARADNLFGLDCAENVRSYLGMDEEGAKRKSTLVNMAIRDTIENRRDLFSVLNSGLVIVARDVEVNDSTKSLMLRQGSIINGAQTMGVLTEYFKDREDEDFPSVNFELLVTDDEELIADISIARNFQNRVSDLSIYGRMGRFDDLEAALKKADASIKLRKRETDFGDDYLDTEKLVQVLTVLAPKDIALPSVLKNKKTPETIYRVYAYRHRSRCLKDFAAVMDDDKNEFRETRQFFLDLAPAAWQLYQRLRGEQAFSILRCVKGDTTKGAKVVTPDGVPDGIIFPMLSALSRFVRQVKGTWKIDVPKSFPWATLYTQARIQETTTAGNNPQTMGKDSDCYIALHGAVEMYFAVMGDAREN